MSSDDEVTPQRAGATSAPPAGGGALIVTPEPRGGKLPMLSGHCARSGTHRCAAAEARTRLAQPKSDQWSPNNTVTSSRSRVTRRAASTDPAASSRGESVVDRLSRLPDPIPLPPRSTLPSALINQRGRLTRDEQDRLVDRMAEDCVARSQRARRREQLFYEWVGSDEQRAPQASLGGEDLLLSIDRLYKQGMESKESRKRELSDKYLTGLVQTRKLRSDEEKEVTSKLYTVQMEKQRDLFKVLDDKHNPPRRKK
eukprot:Hpha_TRINITY_DN4302_c0_g1::TRINITY_DN4302_c0_g1_i1::g.50190::m.50190